MYSYFVTLSTLNYFAVNADKKIMAVLSGLHREDLPGFHPRNGPVEPVVK